MEYRKPKIRKVQGILPPITTNFAPPPVQTSKKKNFEVDTNKSKNILAKPDDLKNVQSRNSSQ